MVECFTKRLNCDCPIFTRVKYLVITKLIIATLICSCIRGISSHAAKFYVLPAGSIVALWKNHRTTSTLCGLMPNLQSSTVPVEFHNCNDSVMRVDGRLWVPTMCSRDILHQAKWGSSWSNPLR
jgi:hypothetical protein